MKTIQIKLEPCCYGMDKIKDNIQIITTLISGDGIRIGVRIDTVFIQYCPWCGKEIDLKVID